MAGITLTQAETQLASYISAETKVLQGQAYEISGRRLTRANLAEIRDGMDFWDRKVKELTNSAISIGRSRTIAPRW
jgi:hypothetical protein